MTDKIKELSDLIQSSSLSKEDKENWLAYIGSLTSFYWDHLIFLFREMPDKISWVNDNFKKKLNALKSKDIGQWRQAMTEEKADISGMFAQE